MICLEPKNGTKIGILTLSRRLSTLDQSKTEKPKQSNENFQKIESHMNTKTASNFIRELLQKAYRSKLENC